MIKVLKNSKYRTGFLVTPIFSIGLGGKDLQVLIDLQTYFGGIGSIRKDGKDAFKFRVESLEQIIKVIIPHFEKYPLLTQKLGDYLRPSVVLFVYICLYIHTKLFKQVIELMKNKEHLTSKGVEKIISIKASMNLGLSTELKSEFPNLNPVERLIIKDSKISHEE